MARPIVTNDIEKDFEILINSRADSAEPGEGDFDFVVISDNDSCQTSIKIIMSKDSLKGVYNRIHSLLRKPSR